MALTGEEIRANLTRFVARWSVRDGNEVQLRDTRTREVLATLPADKPSGIFLTARAHRIGL